VTIASHCSQGVAGWLQCKNVICRNVVPEQQERASFLAFYSCDIFCDWTHCFTAACLLVLPACRDKEQMTNL
jgi:hypothetical protein